MVASVLDAASALVLGGVAPPPQSGTEQSNKTSEQKK
jgi:hypothetical protein